MNRRAEYDDAREREVDGMKPVGKRSQNKTQALDVLLTGAYRNTVDRIAEFALQCIKPDRPFHKKDQGYFPSGNPD